MEATLPTRRAAVQAPADIPIEQLAFSAYRLPPATPEGHRSAPTVYLSLNHWFEAEKFRAYEPELFREALMQPSIKEVRKLAKKNQTRWRFDWAKVRTRALACGLIYASRADAGSARWQADLNAIANMLRPLGLPEPFLGQTALEYVRLRQSPRVVLLGAAAAPSTVVGKKVNALHRRTESAWTLAHWQGRYSCWRIHDWAMSQFVPIEYIADDDSRLTPAALSALAQRCQSAIVFERKGGKTMDRVLRALRALRAERKAQVEIDLFDPDKDTDLTE